MQVRKGIEIFALKLA